MVIEHRLVIHDYYPNKFSQDEIGLLIPQELIGEECYFYCEEADVNEYVSRWFYGKGLDEDGFIYEVMEIEES